MANAAMTRATSRLESPSEDRATPVPLSTIFLAFLRLGLTSFGGPAMVAYIRELAVSKRRWLSEESFRDGVGLCQSIPGATAMQTAAYVGFRVRGAKGALSTFVGFGLPAFLLMLILSRLYEASHNLQPVSSIFRGLQVIVVALVANAAVTFGRSSLKGWRDAVLACAAGAFLFFRGNPIIAIVASGAVGWILYREAAQPRVPAGAGSRRGEGRTLPKVVLAILLGGALLGALYAVNRRLFDLAEVMIKTDLFAFGGGFASLPVMLHQVVDVRAWMNNKTFMDGIALGQVTPGPIVITATFIGYQVAGLGGALVATLAVFSPSFLMVLLTVPYFDRLQKSVLFRRILRGVLASFIGLLLAVTAQFAIAVQWTSAAAVLALAAFVALRLRVEILWVVLAGAGLSFLLFRM